MGGHAWDVWVMKCHPFWRGMKNTGNVAGHFVGFPENSGALFGLVSYNDTCYIQACFPQFPNKHVAQKINDSHVYWIIMNQFISCR